MQGPAVICDTGTGVIKAGFAGDQLPCVNFSAIVGRPMLKFDQGGLADGTLKDLMIGDEAQTHRSMLKLSHPIRDGVIQDWDDMEAVWERTFSQLGVGTNEMRSQRRVVQTEAAHNPTKNRERIVETMFEKFGFGGLNVSVQAILALNSQGLTSGFVVDSGDGVTHLVPVSHGFVEPSLVKRIPIAGRHITDHLMKLLVGQGHPLNQEADFETVREMKQKLCYVAHDLEAERRLARETTVVDRSYTLPDSRTMRIGSERFEAPEILFNPGLAGRHDILGVAEQVYQTIQVEADINLRRDYFKSIVMSGGTTCFPGTSSRLERDLRRMYLERVCQGDKERAKKFKVNVEDPPDRQSMVFLGASIYAAAASQDSPWWISRAEYEEKGASCVQRLIPTKYS